MTAHDELAATHAQCDETISGLSRSIAEARSSHSHERSLLLARIAKLEQELADATTQIAPSDASTFKRYVALKHENKALEQQLAKHQAAAVPSSSSNNVAKKHAVQASLDAAQSALVSATHSTTQRSGNTSRAKVLSNYSDQVNTQVAVARRGSVGQGNTSSLNAGIDSHDHNNSSSGSNRSSRGGDIWPTTITNGDDAEPLYTYEPLTQRTRNSKGGSPKSDAAFQVFAPSANNSRGPSPPPQQQPPGQQQQQRELKAAVYRRPSPVPTAMPGLGSQHLQPDLPSAPPEPAVKLHSTSTTSTDAPPLPRTRRDSSFKPRSSGSSKSAPRATAPHEGSNGSNSGPQASKGSSSSRNGTVRAPSGMGLGPRALF